MNIKEEYEVVSKMLHEANQKRAPHDIPIQITLPAYAAILREILVLKGKVNTLEKEAAK